MVTLKHILPASKRRGEGRLSSRERAAGEERTLKLVLSEDVFRHQASILASVLNSAGEGIVVADANGKFLVFNPMAEKIVGIGAMDIPQEEWSERYGIFYPDAKTPYPSKDLPLARAIQGVETDEVELFLRNTKVPEGVYVTVTGRPLKDEKGVLLGGVVIFRDTSRQKRVEQALREILKGMESRILARTADLLKSNEKLKKASEIQTHLSAMISRELKMPMAAIRESFDLIREGIDGPVSEQQKETLWIGRRMTDGLERLMNNFLNFIKIETDRLTLIFRPTNLTDLIEEAGRLMEATLRKRGLRFTTRLPAEAVRIVGDGPKMKEVVVNLIDLIAKFTARGGEIGLRLEAHDEEIALQLEDSGAGVKKAERDKIFEGFDRSSQGIWRTGGNGVALAVCRAIIERHGGRVLADQTKGTGNLLTVLLPRKGPPAGI